MATMQCKNKLLKVGIVILFIHLPGYQHTAQSYAQALSGLPVHMIK